MKSTLVSIVAAVVLVGCGESQQSAPAPEAKPVEPVAEAAQPEPPPAKAFVSKNVTKELALASESDIPVTDKVHLNK